MGQALLSTIRLHGCDGVIASLDLLIKTHKPAGKVAFRGIHASRFHPMRPAMKYVARSLASYLKSRPWLMRDTGDFLKLIRQTPLSPNVRLLKADISDFFMSGTQNQLVSLTAPVADGPVEDFRELLAELLDTQYVKPNGTTDRVWKTVCGSGMGLVHSGEVSDAAFSRLAEDSLIGDSSLRAKYCIELYARFKDDMFIALGGDSDSRIAFMNTFKARAAFFEVGLESLSSSACTMLDVYLYKGSSFQACGVLDFRIHVKGTSIWNPLSPGSGHAPHVHLTWPQAQLRRHERLCSQPAERASCLETFRCRLLSAGVLVPDQHQPSSRAPRPPNVPSRIVLPWHPGLAGLNLGRVLASLEVDWRSRVGGIAAVGIAWANGVGHLVHRVRAAARISVLGEVGAEDGG